MLVVERDGAGEVAGGHGLLVLLGQCGAVVDEPPSDGLAEGRVVVREEQMRVPHGVDGVTHGKPEVRVAHRQLHVAQVLVDGFASLVLVLDHPVADEASLEVAEVPAVDGLGVGLGVQHDGGDVGVHVNLLSLGLGTHLVNTTK